MEKKLISKRLLSLLLTLCVMLTFAPVSLAAVTEYQVSTASDFKTKLALNETKTIKLTQDITATGAAIRYFNGAATTLDLNGKTLTLDLLMSGQSDRTAATELHIKNGSIVCTAAPNMSYGAAVRLYTLETLELTNVNITTQNIGVLLTYNYSANVIMNSGNINTVGIGIANDGSGTVTIKGGNISNAYGNLQNAAGTAVSRISYTLPSGTEGTDVSSMTFTSNGSPYSYDMTGAKSFAGGKVSVYLPVGPATMTYGGKTYTGTVTADGNAQFGVFTATITTKKDGSAYTTHNIGLSDSPTTYNAAGTVSRSSAVFTFSNLSVDKTYYLWNNENIMKPVYLGKSFTVTSPAIDYNYYTVTLNKSAGVASVIKSPDKTEYGEGETISLSAVLQSGYTWDKWSDNNKTQTNRSITVTSKVELTASAIFAPVLTPVNIQTTGSSVVYGYTSGASVSVSAAPADANHTITGYQWYDSGTTAATSGGVAISGATGTTYTVPTGKAAGQYWYYCAITTRRTDTGTTGSAVTAPVSVQVARADSAISIFDKTVTYSAIAVAYATSEAVTAGSQGEITFTYYTNSVCTTLTGTFHGAATAGGAPANAGTYYVKATLAADDNHEAKTSAAAKLTILPDYLSCSVDEVSVIYNPSGQYLTVGAITHTSDCSYWEPTYYDEDKNAIEGNPKNAGTYYVKVKFYSNTNNYLDVESDYVKFVIQPKEVAIQNAAVQSSKEYDGNTAATITSCGNIQGAYVGDDVSIVTGSAVYANKAVETGKTVTFSGFSLTGAAVSNYVLTAQPQSTTADITARELTVTVTINRKQFDGTTVATISEAAISGKIPGDAVTLQNGTPVFTSAAVATGIAISFTAPFAITGADSANYRLTQPTGVTGEIYNDFVAVEGVHYTVSAHGWTNQEIVVTPMPGYLLGVGGSFYITPAVYGAIPASERTETHTIQNSTTGAISQEFITDIKIDKVKPTATVTLENNSWYQFLNDITFGLFFKETKEITLTPADEHSGVASAAYYVSETGVSRAAIEALADSEWTSGTAVRVTAEDAKRFVAYFKVTDHAGNVEFFSSNGAAYDLYAPVINGVENGKTYYVTQLAEIVESGLKSVTVNGQSVSGTSVLLSGNESYMLVAEDNAGNSASVTVTLRPLSDLTASLAGITVKNVNATQRQLIEAVRSIAAAQNISHATENEKAEVVSLISLCDALLNQIDSGGALLVELEAAVNRYNPDIVTSDDADALLALRGKLQALLNAGTLLPEQTSLAQTLSERVSRMYTTIVNAEQAMNSDEYKQAAQVNENNVQLSDRAALLRAQRALEAALSEHELHLTASEIKTVKERIAAVERALQVTAKVSAVTAKLNALAQSGSLADLTAAKAAYDALSTYEKTLIDTTLVKLLDGSSRILRDQPTGVTVRPLTDTALDPATVLKVTPIVPGTAHKRGVQLATSGQSVVSLFNIELLVNGKTVSLNGGKVRVTLTLTDEQLKQYKDFQIVYIDDNGKATVIPSTLNGNTLTFETDHFSSYGITGTPIDASNAGDISVPNTSGRNPIMALAALAALSVGGMLAAGTGRRKGSFNRKSR